MVRKPMTIQYPDRIPKPLPETLPSNFRGVLEVDISTCTGCLACMKRCPIDVILIVTERDPETKKNFLTRFEIDASKCMVCGLCTEVCPTGAIRHSTEFEASSWNIMNLVLLYVQPGEKVPVYKMVKDQPAQGLPQNKPFQHIRKAWDSPAPIKLDSARGKVRWK
ncbi:MAG: 4Fe-4S binding protein [Candidatus Zhuqueibacterota bacterium]